MIQKIRQWWLLGSLFALLVSACGAAPAQSWPGLAASTDTIYIAFGANVFALNVADGTQRWKFPAENNSSVAEFFSDPVLDGDALYVTSYNKTAYAVDAKTGKLIWEFKGSKDRLIAAPAVTGDAIYIASADNNLYALSKKGELKWTFTAKNGLWAAPAATDKVVYIPSMDHSIYAIDAANGKTLWSVELNGALAGTPTLSKEKETLFVGTLSDTLYALDASNGKEKWKVKSEGWVWGSAVVDGNTLYFGDLRGAIFSVNASEGKINWKQQLGSAVRGAPVVIGDKLFVIAEDGLAFSLKTSDGSTVWKKSIDDENADRLLGNPLVVNELVVIAPIYAKNWLYALNINDGTTKWFFKP